MFEKRCPKKTSSLGIPEGEWNASSITTLEHCGSNSAKKPINRKDWISNGTI